MEDAERILRGLVFSVYEAKVLVALLRKHPANGYEISKLAAGPTSKVYSVLADLKNSGFVVAEETARSVRYEPIPLDELTGKIRSTYDKAIVSLIIDHISTPARGRF
jgi:sugar-specific transcriptional regulator TrmB